MQTFDSLLLQLNDLQNISALRVELVLLIFQNLYLLKDSLDDWEKDHFGNAISSLALNVNSMQQPTNAWLRLCLIDLEKALTPKGERNERSFRPGTDVADRSYDQLAATLDSLGQKIGLPRDWCSEKRRRET
jgi:hypothetical protein